MMMSSEEEMEVMPDLSSDDIDTNIEGQGILSALLDNKSESDLLLETFRTLRCSLEFQEVDKPVAIVSC
ncbi:hypothetical protein Q3G72_033938 [Acer saccharum]|nr:hypothetical protein Q3G72_033938 [Acer saccharum]